MIKIWRNIKDIILSFFYPYGKVYLISFPNSGRSWLMHMLKEILQEIGNSDFEIEATHDCSEIIIEDGTRQNPNIIFNYTDRYRYRRSKVIFLARDPRDVINSNFYQVTNRSKNPFKFKSKSDFIKHRLYGFCRIIHFYNLWFENKSKPLDFLLVKYEDLLESTNDLKKIFSFLSIDVNQQVIKKIYDLNNAERMRKMELKNELTNITSFGKKINQLKVRKAKKGSYIDEMSEKDIDFCNSKIGKLNPYFSYIL